MNTISSLRLLIAEDNPADAELILEVLRKAGYDPSVKQVDREADFVKALSADLDLVISDFHMPHFSAPRAFELLRAGKWDIPFIIVSGTIGEDTAVEAMRSGVTDYLLKDRLARLPAAVERALQEGRDQRDRRRIERALQESEARLRTVTDTAQIGLVIIDPDHFYRYANPAYAQLLRLPSSDLAGRHVSEVSRAEYVPQIKPQLDRAFKGESVHYELEAFIEGKRRIFAVSYQRGIYQDCPVVVVVISDVTDLKRTEAALRSSEARFRSTLDRLMEGCQIISRDWRYLYCNEVAARQGHRSVDELIGRTMMEVYPGIEKTPVFDVLRQCMADSTPRTIENHFVERDRATWFQLFIQPVPEGLFILSLDISARKQAEEKIQTQLAELQRWHGVLLGREDRVITLKREVNELLTKAGESPRYPETEI